MSKRAGILITDNRDLLSYRLYRQTDGDLVMCGRDLLETLTEYIGRNSYINLYDLYNSIMDSKQYELVNEEHWDEECRYYINILNDTQIELIAKEIDWDKTTNMKESTFKEAFRKVLDISEDKPIYKIEFNQQEIDFIKNHINKILDDEDIKPGVKQIANDIMKKL